MTNAANAPSARPVHEEVPRPEPDPARCADALTWLGHATCVLDLGGARIVTDPLLKDHAGLLRRRGGTAPLREVWDDPDAVLVSHMHYDHAHVASLRRAEGLVLSAPANAAWLAERGLRTEPLEPGAWWSPPGTEDVRLRTVVAVHGDRKMPNRPNETVGFVLVHEHHTPTTFAGAALRIWFAGDTELYPDLETLADQAGGPIDLALVPIGGWGPRLSGGHMDPVQAARACAVVGARRAVPIHWGTLHAPFMDRLGPRGWMDRGGAAFLDAMAREAPDCVPALLAPGERLAV